MQSPTLILDPQSSGLEGLLPHPDAMTDSETGQTFADLMQQPECDYPWQVDAKSDDPSEEPDRDLGEEFEAVLQPTSHLEPVDHTHVVEQAPNVQTDHEVMENLMAMMVEDGQLTQDEDWRRVVTMRLNVPGRGDVRVRMWQKADGLDLKLKASDPSTQDLIQTNAAQLRQGMADRGVSIQHLDIS